MSIQSGLITGADHVGLPSTVEDWSQIRRFWEGLGLTCRIYEVTDSAYDHAGAGARLQVYSGSQLIISYFDLPAEDPLMRALSIELAMSSMHVALVLAPPALEAARAHPAFDRETHWGHGNTSIFIKGPYDLHVELVTTNPDFHRDLN